MKTLIKVALSMEMPLFLTCLYLQEKHKTNSRKKKAISYPKQMLKTKKCTVGELCHWGNELIQRFIPCPVCCSSLGGGDAAVQAMLQQQGAAGPDCLQRGENQLFSASSDARALPGRYLNLPCELPAESFCHLGLWYTRSPRIEVSTSMIHFWYIL